MITSWREHAALAAKGWDMLEHDADVRRGGGKGGVGYAMAPAAGSRLSLLCWAVSLVRLRRPS